MPFLAPIAAIAGTAASAAGGLASSGAQSASANYQSQIASSNAVLAGMQRASAISAGHEQTEEKSLQGALEFGRAKAAMGANGVDVNTGSNVDVLAGNRIGSQLAAETTLANASKAAWGYQNQETSYGNQAQLFKSEAQSDQIAGLIKAGGGLLSATTSLPGLGNVSTGFFGSASPVAGNGLTDDTFNGLTDEMIMGG